MNPNKLYVIKTHLGEETPNFYKLIRGLIIGVLVVLIPGSLIYFLFHIDSFTPEIWVQFGCDVFLFTILISLIIFLGKQIQKMDLSYQESYNKEVVIDDSKIVISSFLCTLISKKSLHPFLEKLLTYCHCIAALLALKPPQRMEISFAEIRAFSSRYLIFTDESGSDRFWYLRLETAAGIYIIWTGYLRNGVEIENIFREVINRPLV